MMVKSASNKNKLWNLEWNYWLFFLIERQKTEIKIGSLKYKNINWVQIRMNFVLIVYIMKNIAIIILRMSI